MWTVVEIKVVTGPSDHMYSYHEAPPVFVCPHQGALVLFVHVGAWRTTAGTYPETQILHSWTLRLMQGISEHFWQQLSPISSGKSCNKQLVYNDAFNTEQEHNTNTFGCQDAGISYGYLQLKVDVVAQILYAFTCVVNSSFLVGGEISYRSIGKSIKFCVHQYLVAYSLIGKLLFFLEVHIFGYWLGNNYIPKLAEQY